MSREGSLSCHICYWNGISDFAVTFEGDRHVLAVCRTDKGCWGPIASKLSQKECRLWFIVYFLNYYIEYSKLTSNSGNFEWLCVVCNNICALSKKTLGMIYFKEVIVYTNCVLLITVVEKKDTNLVLSK